MYVLCIFHYLYTFSLTYTHLPSDADVCTQVSGLTLSMDSTRITWNPIPLIEAHHFFNYTITYTPTGSGTQKRQTPMMQTLSYSACSTSCSLTLLELPVNVVYTVTVTITRSTNPGVSGEQDNIPLSCV